ncbi:hypothetical protein [Frondihabitans australicus]|uniref:Uncharacterized protein n=1 Tax=Frondihabitans australicus TaxID=386892 RepID=A0A495IGA4_9MICO|nr:hypothetical protein [Frondihabitans australicus]RKR74690.1 hypothetical protein C8E83_1817 [Frondihabitans australicus]
MASKALPLHTIVIWQSAGHKALAASRSDFEVGVLVTGAVVLFAYLVAAALMAVVPTRHVLVPHAAFWKAAENRAEMRRRYAVYLGRAFCFTYLFIAAEIVVAIVSQHNRALEVSWLPTVVSLVYVVLLLIYSVWVFADGFRVPRRPSTGAPQRASGGSSPGGRGRA